MRGAKLGQHFLNNPFYAKELVRAAGITPKDTVIEIGPGEGALTRELLATGAHVIAIEKDRELVRKLHLTMWSEIEKGSLRVIEGDVRDNAPEILKLESGKYILAANIPYYITGEIIRDFLTARAQPKTIALLIQKEVAKRILDKKESVLSISVKVYGTPSIVAIVKRGNFTPAPGVDSAIIAISNISRDRLAGLDEHFFFHVVRSGFAAKRKVLSSNLGVVFGKEVAVRALETLGIVPFARAEEISVEKWIAITKILAQSQ